MVAFSCDLPARCLVLNMRQFNGAHGCHLCEDEGVTSVRNPLLRWWPFNPASVLRSKESLIQAAVHVTLTNTIVKF